MFDNPLLLLNVLRMFEQEARGLESVTITRLVPNSDERQH